MNQIYFEFPFLHINNYQIMPSLIVFLVFLGILVLWNFLGNVDKIKSNPDINTSSAKQRYRYILKNTFIFGTSYGMIFLLSYFFKDEKDLGDKANIIVKLANAYLKIELVVVLIMFFAFMYIFLVNKNKKAYFEFLKKPIVILLYISAFSYAVTHQIELGYNYNWLRYICLALFSIFIFSVDIIDKIIEDEQREKCNPYSPIKNYNRLCKSQKEKADELKDIIERNSNFGGISILVKGDWGIGKTSVVNGAIEELKKESKYEELRINALEIDSLESLFNYFFDFIRMCLKERGAYTGIASEYREFVSSALGIVTNESFGNLFTRLFYSENKNYRDKKDELEKSIENVLGKDKIIIVVDDIERCEKEKVKQFISFIKEIATMNNCITIFISDEKALKECILNDNNNNTDMNDFLDKFFNDTVSVNTTDYEDILEKMEKDNKNKNSFLSLAKLIKDILEKVDIEIIKIKKILDGIESVDEEEYLNRLNLFEKFKNEFLGFINNSRRIIKIGKSYLEYQNKVILNLKKYRNENNEENRKYLEEINASCIIFILSYIDMYFSEYENRININDFKFYFDKISLDTPNEKHNLLKALTYKFWLEKHIDENVDIDEKNIRKKNKFIYNLLKEKEITPSNFTKKEDELLDFVKKGKWVKLILEKEYINALKIIISTPRKLYEEKFKYLEYINIIFKYVKIHMIKDTLMWTEILLEIKKELFDNLWNDSFGNPKEFYNTHFIWNLGTNMCIMKSIYNIFFEDDSIINKLSINNETIENKIKVFAIYFISYRLRIASSIIFYIPSIEGDCKRKILDDMNFLESKSDFKDIECIVGDWVNTILKNIEDIDALKINNKIENEFEKLYSLLDATELYLENKDILKYKDVKDDLKLSRNSIEDIKYFLKISRKLLSNLKKIEINNNNLVQNFIDKCRNKQITPLEIRDFYDRIKLDSRIYINKKQIDELQNLISEHEKVNKGYAKGYRQILLWHSERINKSEKI